MKQLHRAFRRKERRWQSSFLDALLTHPNAFLHEAANMSPGWFRVFAFSLDGAVFQMLSEMRWLVSYLPTRAFFRDWVRFDFPFVVSAVDVVSGTLSVFVDWSNS